MDSTGTQSTQRSQASGARRRNAAGDEEFEPRAESAATDPPGEDPAGADSTAEDSAGNKRGGLFSWLARKVSGAIKWVAKLLRAPLRPLVRIPLWLLTRSPLRKIIGALIRPRQERGFGFWWLIATLIIAGAIGLLVAVLLSPVAGILAALVVGIWMLFRRRSDSRGNEEERGQERGNDPTAPASRRASRSAAESPARWGGAAPIATSPGA